MLLLNKLHLLFFLLGSFILVGCSDNPTEETTCVDKPICEKASDACECAIKCLSSEPPPAPPKKPVAIIILDLSGSMTDPISVGSSTQKIQDAKRVVRKIVDHPKSASINLGFIGLGHKKAGCDNNVEILLYPENKNNNSILQTLPTLIAKGETPLAQAIVQAGKILNEKKSQGYDQLKIVLVSDGEESCSGNPIDEVKKLKKTGLEFVFHAIGYGTDKSANKILKRLALLGDGTLYKPYDYKQLRNDITNAVFGMGNMNVTEFEDSNAYGWKLYDNKEQVIQINRSTSVRERLWLTRPAIVGKYEFCLYTRNEDNGTEKAYAKRIEIKANKLTTVDSVKLIDSLE